MRDFIGRKGSSMGISYRKYKSYEDYKRHQASKLDKLVKKKKNRWNNKVRSKNVEKRAKKFEKRLRPILEYVKNKKVLCIGARNGAEVKAFKNLGIENSIGIDLNPGENNPYVIKGDFNYTPFKNDSFDVIYFNSIDHIYKIEIFSREMHRILKENAYLIIEEAHVSSDDNKKRDYISNPKKYESFSCSSVKDIENGLKEFVLIETMKAPYDKKRILLIFKNRI